MKIWISGSEKSRVLASPTCIPVGSQQLELSQDSSLDGGWVGASFLVPQLRTRPLGFRGPLSGPLLYANDEKVSKEPSLSPGSLLRP